MNQCLLAACLCKAHLNEVLHELLVRFDLSDGVQVRARLPLDGDFLDLVFTQGLEDTGRQFTAHVVLPAFPTTHQHFEESVAAKEFVTMLVLVDLHDLLGLGDQGNCLWRRGRLLAIFVHLLLLVVRQLQQFFFDLSSP